MEPLGKGCDRSVRTPELLQNAASGGVRERAERGIEVGLARLNHTVQYNNMGDGMQWEAERPLRCRLATLQVHGTKNSWRDRPVLVGGWAWPSIAAAAKGKLPDAPLFVGEDGEQATYYRALAAHRAAVEALKLPSSYTMPDARHRFAGRCMKAAIAS